MSNTIRVRFAPSPTGHLHIGGLRTALFNYFFAKKNNGSYLMRIEDTDVVRSTNEFTQSILDSFNWLSIAPDEPLLIQSSRFEEHMKSVEKLISEKKAYRCYCTDAMIANRVGKSESDFYQYDRYCYDKQDQEGSFVIRFLMVNDSCVLSFDDLIRGPISFQTELFDDFIIVRSDGIPVYNLVVVLDDAYMKISHVIRGEEHIGNTPRQIALYQAFGYSIPYFAHLPMILGPEGQKLSKRDGAKSVYQYKTEGYLPDALINYLMRLGWSHGDQELFSNNELKDFFNLESVGKKGAIFDQAKLDWMNGQYLKKMSAIEIIVYIKKFLDSNFGVKYSLWSYETLCSLIDLFKGRVLTLCDLIKACDSLFSGPTDEQIVLHKELFTNLVIQAIKKVGAAIETDQLNQDYLKAIAKNYNCSLTTLMQSLRILLIGEPMGPGIFDLIAVLGRKESYLRFNKEI